METKTTEVTSNKKNHAGWWETLVVAVVVAALMLAGGATAVADKRFVRVTRREKDGNLKRFTVNIETIGKEGRSDLDIALKPGDVIWVPESWY